MVNLSTTDYLLSELPEYSWPWVISALRNDPIVWKRLDNVDFIKLAIRKIGDEPKRWNPINLALLELDEKIDLRDPIGVNSLNPDLLKDRERILKGIDNSRNLSLQESGLLALYFLQHPEHINRLMWKTPCACLFGLLEEPVTVLSSIKPDLAVHAVLTNPQPEDDQKAIFFKLLSSVAPKKRFEIIKELSLRYPKLAQVISSEILEKNPHLFNGIEIPSQSYQQVKNILSVINEAEVLSITNQFDNYHSRMNDGLGRIRHLQSLQTTDLMKSLISQKAINKAGNIWSENKSLFNSDQIASFILILEFNGYSEEISKWFQDIELNNYEDSENPDHKLALGIYSYINGNKEKALNLASESLEAFENTDIDITTQLFLMARLFNKTKKHNLAIQTLSRILGYQPNNLEALTQLSKNLKADNYLNEAVKTSQLIVLLYPERIDLRRDFARNLENNNQWSSAMHEWETIVSNHVNSDVSDSYKLATCCTMAEQPQRAASICQQILINNPNDSQAHFLLGEAYRALGDPNKALGHYEQAIDISPNCIEAWLALAATYENLEKHRKSNEILQAGSLANPNNPEILLALGKKFYIENALTQAQAFFQQADDASNDLESNSSKTVKANISQYLGDTQRLLGHLDESLENLQSAYKRDSSHLGVAHSYAKTLIALGFPEKAKPILSETRLSEPGNLDIQLDYAKTCLATGVDLEDAEDSLLIILKINPENAHAKALLAETFEARLNYDQALKAYKEALISPPDNDPYWHSHLSLGMGRVSLALNDPGTAIAVLNDSLSRNKEDVILLRTLSSAYQFADLKEKALKVAQSALDVDPDNEENLDWFIQQAITLKASDKAVEVLKESLAKNQAQANLLNKLGWLYISEENYDSAKDSFFLVKSIDHVTPSDLFTAAKGLLRINESQKAIDCLEKAIALSAISNEDPLLPELYFTEALAHRENGDLVNAKNTLDEAIEISSNNPELVTLKTQILFELGEGDNAIIALEEGIDTFPNDIALRSLAVSIYRNSGDLTTAMMHVKFTVNEVLLENNQLIIDSSTKAQFADLACALLEYDIARDILEIEAIPESEELSSDDIFFYCLLAELALDAKEEVAAADSLTTAIKINPEHPQVLALQARITALNGSPEAAEEILQLGLKAIGLLVDFNKVDPMLEQDSIPTPYYQSPSIYIALSEACLFFHQWSVAIYLLKKVIEIAPNEPRSHFSYARALCLRAEYQRLCNAVEIITHAPGESATAEFAKKRFDDAILKAANLFTEHANYSQENPEGRGKSKPAIAIWLARGHAVFQPSPEHVKALKLLPIPVEKSAPYIASLINIGNFDIAAKVSKKIFDHTEKSKSDPTLYAQISLALQNENPEIALQSIQIGIDLANWNHLPNLPLYYSVQAFVAQKLKNQTLQLEAILAAIQGWPDEPRWLAYAADILLAQGSKTQVEAAIEYLEKAADAEPYFTNHHIKLSDAFQKLGDIPTAISVLENATHQLSDKAIVWLELANLYYLNQDIPQTIRCAKNAIANKPSLGDALLLLADVSLDVGNPDMALNYADEYLAISPDNTLALKLKKESYQALGQPSLALSTIEKMLVHLPKSIPMELDRINLISETQGVEKAIESLNSLNEKFPQDINILTALAENLAKSGDQEAAINAAQGALKDAPNDIDPIELARLSQLLGRLLRRSGQLDQAIHQLSEAINISQHNSGLYVELGRCYQEQRQYSQALEQFHKAIKIKPDDPKSHYFAGLVFKESKDFENAERMFKKASRLSPTDINIHRQLAAVTAINIVQSNRLENTRIPIPN